MKVNRGHALFRASLVAGFIAGVVIAACPLGYAAPGAATPAHETQWVSTRAAETLEATAATVPADSQPKNVAVSLATAATRPATLVVLPDQRYRDAPAAARAPPVPFHTIG